MQKKRKNKNQKNPKKWPAQCGPFLLSDLQYCKETNQWED